MSFEYETPDFISTSDEDTIHQRMLDVIPDDIDKSEGGWVWDNTRPTAIELSRFIGFNTNESLKLIWPMFSSGIYLDFHGDVRNLPRKSGIASSGGLTISGTVGTVIPAGSLFSTVSTPESEGISFEAAETYTIPLAGTIDIQIICTQPGVVGNVPPDTITLKVTPNNGIISVSNSSYLTGGINPESDDDYKQRIVDYDRNKNISYVGNVSDYYRWAMEVNGVGGVNVVPPTDDSGIVTLVIVDGNGDPASDALCQEVYNHIMSPGNPTSRKAPIGPILEVIAPTNIAITVSATVELQNTNIHAVKDALLPLLEQYCKDCISDGEFRYTRLCSIIGSINGVYDFQSVLLNNGTSNVAFAQNYMPSIVEEDITLTAGTVS